MTPVPDAVAASNGSHESSAQQSVLPESTPPREYHAEGREPNTPHEPIAHFEPSPRPDTAAPANKPYVVWSSAPPQKESGSRGPEE